MYNKTARNAINNLQLRGCLLYTSLFVYLFLSKGKLYHRVRVLKYRVLSFRIWLRRVSYFRARYFDVLLLCYIQVPQTNLYFSRLSFLIPECGFSPSKKNSDTSSYGGVQDQSIIYAQYAHIFDYLCIHSFIYLLISTTEI